MPADQQTYDALRRIMAANPKFEQAMLEMQTLADARTVIAAHMPAGAERANLDAALALLQDDVLREGGVNEPYRRTILAAAELVAARDPLPGWVARDGG